RPAPPQRPVATCSRRWCRRAGAASPAGAALQLRGERIRRACYGLEVNTPNLQGNFFLDGNRQRAENGGELGRQSGLTKNGKNTVKAPCQEGPASPPRGRRDCARGGPSGHRRGLRGGGTGAHALCIGGAGRTDAAASRERQKKSRRCRPDRR